MDDAKRMTLDLLVNDYRDAQKSMEDVLSAMSQMVAGDEWQRALQRRYRGLGGCHHAEWSSPWHVSNIVFGACGNIVMCARSYGFTGDVVYVQLESMDMLLDVRRVDKGTQEALARRKENARLLGVLTKTRNEPQSTCLTCEAHNFCPFAFDGYCSNGDCLAEK